jgi:large subunit ribosomal protein L22
MAYRYAKQIDNPEHVAKALGLTLPISTKHAIEICTFIRKKEIQRAKTMLEDVIKLKIPVPLKRFNWNVGHKKGKIMAGRYPVKACKEILKLIKSAEANAQFKGLNTSNLIITHIAANRAAKQQHYGRQRRREMKRTHVQIMLEEKAEKQEKKQNKEGKKA